jgi:lysophospholipase L1-like esterase
VKIASGGTNILVQLSPAAAGSSRNFLSSESVKVGDIANLQALNGSNDTLIPSIQYTIVHPNAVLAKSTAMLAAMGAATLQSKSDVAAIRRGKKTLQRQFFPGVATPTGWTLNGWTVNNGLVAPAPAANLATHARWNSYANANYMTLCARFLVTDATTSRFGIYSDPTQGQFGGGWIVDAATSTIAAYSFVGVTLTVLAAQYGKTIAIPPLVAGREYLMTVRGKGLDNEIEWRDCKTGAVVTALFAFTASSHDNFRGRHGLVYLAGAVGGVTCKLFDLQALFEAPKIVLVGDSNTWGGSIGASSTTLKPDEWKKAWPYLLDAQRSRGDVFNGGRGGETAATWAATNMQDANITPWSPDYWVIALGTNDTVQATWRTNMATVIAACAARGGQIVLSTVPPKGTGQALVDTMNADIKAQFFGAYPYVDFASALSTNNDGTTQNAALFNTDLIHANVDGHAAMFTQIKADAPYLLLA